MHLQFITTQEDLQCAISLAVKNAFSQLTPVSERAKETVEIIDGKELLKRLLITEPTLIRWRKKGKIPFLQIGSAIRYNYSAVLAALESSKKGKVNQ